MNSFVYTLIIYKKINEKYMRINYVLTVKYKVNGF